MSDSKTTRRDFLRVSAVGGGGMLVAFSLFGCKDKKKGKNTGGTTGKPGTEPAPTPSGPPTDLNAWLRIDPDNKIRIHVPDAEMGQGVLTSVPMLIADELGARWEDVRSEHAPANAKAFGRQSTGGSTTIRMGFENFRTVGATAREMLVSAAAAKWKVDAAQCEVRDGAVHNKATKATLTFGALAADAAKLTPPGKPKLKPDKELRYVGKELKRLDTGVKVDGSAVYGMDVKLPGLLTATVAHSPVFGGTVKSFDDSKAKAVPGVRHVVQIPSGVAVVADNFWSAKKGREALKVVWSEGKGAALSDATIIARCKKALRSSNDAHKSGDSKKALAAAKTKLQATYHVPYLAHAPMEPLNCTAHVEADKCTLWVPTQSVTSSLRTAAKIAGVPRDKVVVNTTFLGGGFGRRSQTDFVAEAVHIAKQVKKPVKLVWPREDDVQGGYYRPMAYNEFRAGLDAKGMPVAWEHEIASPSILQPMVGTLKDGVDGTSVEGAANLPYAIPNQHITYANPDLPVSLWFWRSVGSSQNAFVTECFLDEVAKAGGKDPVELRRSLLEKEPRHKRVFEKVVKESGWGTPLPKGRARGIAVHKSFGSYVAQVAEVSIEAGNKIRVHRVVCAIDCGRVINPDTIRAQAESGIVYGLSAALYGQVRIDKGRAVESNFHDYKVVRMAEMPKVETHIVVSGDPIGGIGEVTTPPIAPAVCNALFALTGKPIRRLPIRLA